MLRGESWDRGPEGPQLRPRRNSGRTSTAAPTTLHVVAPQPVRRADPSGSKCPRGGGAGRPVGLPARPLRRKLEGTQVLAAPPGDAGPKDSALDRGEALLPMVPSAPRPGLLIRPPHTHHFGVSGVSLSPSYEPHDRCRWHKGCGRATGDCLGQEDSQTPARLGA